VGKDRAKTKLQEKLAQRACTCNNMITIVLNTVSRAVRIIFSAFASFASQTKSQVVSNSSKSLHQVRILNRGVLGRNVCPVLGSCLVPGPLSSTALFSVLTIISSYKWPTGWDACLGHPRELVLGNALVGQMYVFSGVWLTNLPHASSKVFPFVFEST
jgi:hypothetical protein